MMRAGVSDNAIELTFSRSEAKLLALSVVLVAVLAVLAGWPGGVRGFGLELARSSGGRRRTAFGRQDPRTLNAGG